MKKHKIELGAEQVKEFALAQGYLPRAIDSRPCYEHMGAVIADSILQAGLKYSTIVFPRIQRILKEYPQVKNTENVMEIIEGNETRNFLNWQHFEKINRFEDLSNEIHEYEISNIDDLKLSLNKEDFRIHLLTIHGVGPKTIDYMGCLVGLETIAVDRHILKFAERAGIQEKDYSFIKEVFCLAADILCSSRRVFDAWIWETESNRSAIQKSLKFDA